MENRTKMTQEQKQILLQDLCSRLPYGVKIDCFSVHRTLESIAIDHDGFITIDCGGDHFYHPFSNELHKGCLPYLRPITSMTEEEIEMYFRFRRKDTIYVVNPIHCDGNSISAVVDGLYMRIFYEDLVSLNTIDFLNSIYIDYRGLIPMGLALPAPEEMYND